MSGFSAFRCVSTIGTVLTAEALASAAELRMPGQSAADYQLPPGTTVNAAVARSWDTLLAAHREWHKALEKLPEGDPAIKVTREKWLLPLLYELGWGRVDAVPSGLEVEPGLADTAPLHFPISHRWSYPDAANPTAWVPLHLVGAGINLDTKTPGAAARAPQSMLQDYLNRENRALWAVLSNGRQLRLLRDASALTRQSYVEFDLNDIFTNQLYADFRLLFLTAHASRQACRQRRHRRRGARGRRRRAARSASRPVLAGTLAPACHRDGGPRPTQPPRRHRRRAAAPRQRLPGLSGQHRTARSPVRCS